MSLRRFAFLVSVLVLPSLCLGQRRVVIAPAPSTNSSAPVRSSSNPFSGAPGIPLSTADQEGKIEYRAESILIQVPVVVTDKSGSHIHGLTKTDFHLEENGKEQAIATMEELISSTTQIPGINQQPGEFSNLTLSDQQPRNVVVIALDTINTPYLDQAHARQQLVKYLGDSLDSHEVLALLIMSSHGIKIVQGITGDPVKLIQVLKKVGGELPAMQGVDADAVADVGAGDIPDLPVISPGNATTTMEDFVEHGNAIYAQYQQANAIEDTLNSFLAIAWSLSGVPGRKSLIWATGGFPFLIGSPATVPGGTLSQLYEHTMAALTQAQISVYPVDVRGLVNTAMSDASSSRMLTTRQMDNRSLAQQSTISSLTEFADMTGGKAFYNTNDLASSFKRAADDASSYYLISYYLDLKNDRAGWRNLKVKVDKKDLSVRARKGFFVTNATIHAELTRNLDLGYALSSPIEGTGVPMSMKWSGVSGSGPKKNAMFTIHIPPNGISVHNTDGENHLNLDLVVAAYADKSKDGKPAVTTGVTFKNAVTEAQLSYIRSTGMSFNNMLEISPGQYTVRVVLRDNSTGKIGSVTAPLTVN